MDWQLAFCFVNNVSYLFSRQHRPFSHFVMWTLSIKNSQESVLVCYGRMCNAFISYCFAVSVFRAVNASSVVGVGRRLALKNSTAQMQFVCTRRRHCCGLVRSVVCLSERRAGYCTVMSGASAHLCQGGTGRQWSRRCLLWITLLRGLSVARL